MQKRTIIFALILLTTLTAYAGACVSSSGAWVNCTIVSNTTPMNDIVQTVKVNAPWGFFFLYIAIYMCIVILLLVQDRSLSRFNYATLLGLIVGITFEMYNLFASPAVLVIPVSLFVLSLIMSIAFK